MKPTSEEIYAGQSIYTPRILAFYDFGVLTLSNSFYGDAQRQDCFATSTKILLANHLDIGVGSGFFLDKCNFPTPHPRIGLMDLNPAAIKYTAAPNMPLQSRRIYS